MVEILAVFLPLLGFLSSSCFVYSNARHCDVLAKIVTIACMIGACSSSLYLFYDVFFEYHDRIYELAPWITINDWSINWSLRTDALSVAMLCVITIVSLLVHVYSLGYMSHDASQARFMSFLSLFTFTMLMLVASNNLLQLFFGWEGVGLASYLLIGFWHQKSSACNAAMKAFIVNRVGDFALILAIIGIFCATGSSNFDGIFANVQIMSDQTFDILGYKFHLMTVLCMLLAFGAMGKSAQIGLHVWLPDAMEGPTPVSALIHAATMVTAGIFLLIRMSPLIEHSSFCLVFIAVVGAITALFAASVAITQNDIKRVIAYSTCSQLGYMFFAIGMSAYSFALFHLVTHAFFKALLFLGAGSVIHALSGEQDLRKMGGLYRHIPITYALMWIGSLALMGVPGFSGYYSKDLILEAAAAQGSWQGALCFYVGLISAGLTAAYSLRLMLLAFHGKPCAHDNVMAHVHEAPLSMHVPMFVLTLGAVAAGFLLKPIFVETLSWTFVIKVLKEHNLADAMHHLPYWVSYAPLCVIMLASGLALVVYLYKRHLPDELQNKWPILADFLQNKWYFDEVYNRYILKPMKVLALFLSKTFDAQLIDQGGPGLLVRLSTYCGQAMGQFYIRGTLVSYAPFLVFGLAFLTLIFLIRSIV